MAVVLELATLCCRAAGAALRPALCTGSAKLGMLTEVSARGFGMPVAKNLSPVAPQPKSSFWPMRTNPVLPKSACRKIHLQMCPASSHFAELYKHRRAGAATSVCTSRHACELSQWTWTGSPLQQRWANLPPAGPLRTSLWSLQLVQCLHPRCGFSPPGRALWLCSPAPSLELPFASWAQRPRQRSLRPASPGSP